MSAVYQLASRAFATVQAKRGSLKAAVYAQCLDAKDKSKSQPASVVRSVMALVGLADKWHVVIDQVLEQATKMAACRGAKESVTAAGALARAAKDKSLLVVLVAEALFGRGRTGTSKRSGIAGGGALVNKVVLASDGLRMALGALCKGGEPETLLTTAGVEVSVPKYARINPLKWSGSEAEILAELAMTFPEVRGDPVLPRVLRFPPKTDLHSHPLVESGALVIQDRASCLPVTALFHTVSDSGVWPPPADRRLTILDACAAPGSKTSQAVAEAALLTSRGSKDLASAANSLVIGVERDKKRMEVLRRRLEQLGCSGAIARTVQADFLRLEVPSAVVGDVVDACIVDPSCSGSGMATVRAELAPTRRGKRGRDDGPSAGAKRVMVEDGSAVAVSDAPRAPDGETMRVRKLAQFQKAAVLRAMDMPGCRRVVYSTCSVWGEENEGVVASILAERRVLGRWRLIRALPKWETRGMGWPGLTAAESDCLLRADPDRDETQGFFVALFQRTDSSWISND
jgi:25S rRNA (cytosine2278-C5)-methyltransferase